MSRLASHITPLLHQMTSMKGLNYQLLAMGKLLKQPILKDVMLDVVVNSKHYETIVEIVDNLRRGWQGIKAGDSLDEMRPKMLLAIWLFQVPPRILLQ